MQGLNVVRLPHVVEGATASADFVQLTHKYVEVLEFTPIEGAVRNRGYGGANHFDPPCQLDQILLGVTYTQKITDISTGLIIHDEVGQMLFNQDPGVVVDWTVARLAVIPHGQVIEGIGPHSTLDGAEAIKDDIAATMTDHGRGVQFSVEPLEKNKRPKGYAHANAPFDGVETLLDQVDAADAPAMTALKLEFSTTASRGPAGGGIVQLPSQKAQALVEQFNNTYWVESWTDASGNPQMQIQYIQNMWLTFQATKLDSRCQVAYPNLPCLVKWPHYEMNSLRKIADFPFPPAPAAAFNAYEQLPLIR